MSRIEIAGAQVTEAVAEVLDTLQNERENIKAYIRVLDELTRKTIFDIDAVDQDKDAAVLERLRVLQMIRRDLLTLANPPGVDNPENDVPTASF